MMPQPPDFETFQEAYEQGKSQLIWQWLPADLETPVSAYMKLCGNEAYSLLLESIEGGKTLGRYSAIGFAPDLLWKCKDKQASINASGAWETQADALTSLHGTMEASKIDIVPSGLPPMSSSGLFGMIGYDMVRLIEDIPNDNPDMLDIPDALMMRPTIMVIFDNVKQIMCVATPVRPNDDEDAQAAYSSAKIRLGNITKQLADNIPQPYQAKESEPTEAKALTSQAEYEDTVRKAKEYITAGDIFQVVPSVRFEMDFNLEPFEFYRSLRRLNPS
ncbi:MAG TPA: anthranilate synthase component I, partial [Micavibrio sp.]|nr:anthranilate synthase component I [Micavibrio sp.]